MKKITITLLAAFIVSAASAQNKDDQKTAKASAVFSEIVLPNTNIQNNCDPNKELCDTFFLLREWFDPNIKNFKVDTMLCFQCEEENEITSHPNNCFENFPVGFRYIQNGIKRRKE